MPEMIERVARAINPVAFDKAYQCHIPNCPECENHRIDARKQAKAAIRAMREPTEDMRIAGSIDPGAGGPDNGYEIEVYQSMIDAALKE